MRLLESIFDFEHCRHRYLQQEHHFLAAPYANRDYESANLHVRTQVQFFRSKMGLLGFSIVPSASSSSIIEDQYS